ncbi:MAG: hypothetical protein J6K72_09770, partial [Clostridia bacterium]|nr:hypothetical protein [Clostridia bacterium]
METMKTLQTYQNGRCSNKSICKILRLGVLFVLTFLFTLLFYSCAYAASGTIVYENVTMDTRLKVDEGKTLRMILKGDNYFNEGIGVPYGSTLIIEGDGSLTAKSPNYGVIGGWFTSGIGSNDCASGKVYDCGKIIINSGVINVSGHNYSYAIGGETIQGLEINGGVINSTHKIGADHDGNIAIYGGQINMSIAVGTPSGQMGLCCGDNGVLNIYGGIICASGAFNIGVGGGQNSELNMWGGEIRIENANVAQAGVGGMPNSTLTIRAVLSRVFSPFRSKHRKSENIVKSAGRSNNARPADLYYATLENRLS